MARRVFFSFNYQRDVWRVNQIRSMPNIIGNAAAGFHDASLWEQARLRGDDAVRGLIDQGLQNTSVTVVCIGARTAGRRFINYEIRESIARGNGLLGARIHHLQDRSGNTDPPGEIPAMLKTYRVYTYAGRESLASWIEQAARDAGK